MPLKTLKCEKVLVVEDEAPVARVISSVLLSNGYHPILAYTGTEALRMAASHDPDVVLLDLGLPDIYGTEVLRRLRKSFSKPVLIVSARDSEHEKVTALDLGADDYITKPFGASELTARIRAALRHHAAIADALSPTYSVGEFTINFDRHIVYVENHEVHLTRIEFKIVALLAKNHGRVMAYDAIMSRVWGTYLPNDNKILRVNIANIRHKLELDTAKPKYILTETGVGYRMADAPRFIL